MLYLNEKKIILRAFAATIFVLAACAGNRVQVQPIPKSENPVELVNSFDNEVTNARKNQLNVLSPTWFARAEDSLNDAKAELGKGNEISKILDHVAEGRAQLQRAEEMAQLSRTTLPEVIESRNMARAAGATDFEDYAQVEEQFLSLTKAIESNNLGKAQRNQAEVNEAFREIELRAIKSNTLGEVRRLIRLAEAEGARKSAPQSLQVVQEKLRATDAFITKNPYDKEKMGKMAKDALFYARRLIQINAQSKEIKTMQPEQTAIWVEGLLQKTTRKLGAADMRDQSFETQVDNIVGTIKALQEDHDFMIGTAKTQQREIENLKQRIVALEGMTREQQAAEERLMAEKQFNQKFIQVQSYFTADEAEVYKQGNQLVIRLKAIQFPVGKAILMPNTYGLLSKVQKAIRTFGEPEVAIEGYTDSTGSVDVNEHLSQKRAEAVRDYLIANRTLPDKKIIAVGYGSMRPLASNESAAGRAINRRIDVIVKPRVVQ
jgi:outer membrane protein OmpA-like peptidoglycan-associated protein